MSNHRTNRAVFLPLLLLPAFLLPAFLLSVCLLSVCLGLGVAPAMAGNRPDPVAEQVARGKYIFDAAGCLGCHTDEQHGGPALAGGRALITGYGTFYTPNITPDPIYGIGSWRVAAFFRAMRSGISRDGTSLLPTFPFTSYAAIDDADLLDLKAYLMTREPVARPNRPHELKDPFMLRLMMPGWKLLYHKEGPLNTNPYRSVQWNRGQYLVRALGHCGECHTPRNWSGAFDESRAFSGARRSEGGEWAPNITPDPETGIGKWSDADLLLLLEIGLLPDGDVIGGSMAEVVRNSTSRLTLADRKAILDYLRAVPPVRSGP
ncbi:MAG: cytochrome c [Rhodospirillaceae bacterium]